MADMIKLKAALSKVSAADGERWRTEHLIVESCPTGGSYLVFVSLVSWWWSVSRDQLAVACVVCRQGCLPAERRSFTTGYDKEAFRSPRPTFYRAPPVTSYMFVAPTGQEGSRWCQLGTPSKV